MKLRSFTIGLFVCSIFLRSSLFSQSCPSTYTAPAISSEVLLCINETGATTINIGDSATALNEAYEYYNLTSTLPAGATFDENIGQLIYDPATGSGLYESFTMEVCQVIDPSCLTYTDTCSGQTSGITFIYVGSPGQDVFIFESGECINYPTSQPLACAQNLEYGDLVVWPEAPSVNNIDIWIGDYNNSCSSFNCSSPTVVQHVSCATLIVEVMGQVLGGALLGYKAVGNNNGGNKRKEVNNSNGYSSAYCTSTTIKSRIKGTGTIGDQLFLDIDNSGTYSSTGDLPLAGVTVILTDAQGDTLKTTTAADGSYLFDQLPEGSYTITVDQSTLPAGVTNTVDPDNGTLNESSVTIGIGGSNLDQDFGYRGGATISDQLFMDLNGDDIYTAGTDLPIGNVDVTLTDADGNMITTSTDVNGEYSFTGLPAGTYSVSVNTSDTDFPVGVNPSYDADGITTANTTDVTVTANEVNTTTDFGYEGEATISNQLFVDLDGDDVYTAGIDLPIENVDVILTDADGNMITTSTDANGEYSFEGLPAGTYTVSVNTSDIDFPAGVNPSYDADGITTANTTDVTVTANEVNTTTDFGYEGEATISNQLFVDLDGDDVYTAGTDLPIENVDVTLTDADGNMITTSTDANGEYSFTALPAGTYTVSVNTSDIDFPAGVNPSYDADGITTANTTDVTVTANEVNTTTDFGYEGGATISNQLFVDLDGDDVYTAGTDLPIENVDVTLTDADGNMITTSTDANGEYSFTALPAGTYTVSVNTSDIDFPAGVNPSYDADGIATANTTDVTVTTNEINTNTDFGYEGGATISNQLFVDLNGDDLFTVVVDLPIGNVDVILTDADGNMITTSTDANGEYSFTGLPAGTYTVAVNTSDTDFPTGVSPSYDADGIATANTTDVTVTANEINTTTDFGYEGGATISNQLFVDIDGDDVYTAGTDLPIENVDLILTDADGNMIIRSTNANGEYSFTGLPAGTYTVSVNTSDTEFPAGVVASYDADGITTANTTDVTVTANEINTTTDFGYEYNTSIQGSVMNDLGSGATEPLGSTVILLFELDAMGQIVDQDMSGTIDENDAILSTSTDMTGAYTFTKIPFGNYLIEEVDPTGFESVSDTYTDNDNQIVTSLDLTNQVSSNNDFVDKAIILPVELISFTGEFETNHVLLLWATGIEINNDYFEIERSYNGIDFASIGRIAGAGNSIDISHYQLVDKNPMPEINYYRLKQVDYDGQHNYSNIIAIQNDLNTTWNVFPNPTTNYLQLTTDIEDINRVEIHGSGGKLLKTIILENRFKGQPITIDMDQYAPGTYIISVLGKQFQKSEVVIKR